MKKSIFYVLILASIGTLCAMQNQQGVGNVQASRAPTRRIYSREFLLAIRDQLTQSFKLSSIPLPANMNYVPGITPNNEAHAGLKADVPREVTP